MHPIITLFNHDIETFQIMATLGTLLGMLLLLWECKQEDIDTSMKNDMLVLMVIGFVFGFIFSAISDKIAHWGETAWYVPAGISFAGGAIGAFVFLTIFYFKIIDKKKQNYFYHLDFFACPLVLFHCLGRIGCFLGGCCYGKESDSIFAVTFPVNSYQYQQMGYSTSVLPTQLFEAIFLLVLFCILLFIVKKHKAETYFISYGIARFLIEFLRGDNRGGFIAFLSPSQIWSILFVAIGLTLYIVKRQKNTKEMQHARNNKHS